MGIAKEPQVTLDLAIQHGLTEEEYQKVVAYLGREPTYTELGIYSVMWSEHCSYKNSIALLKTLPRTGGRLLVGAGEENAGLVDIGDGLAVCFKIESHNHPSAVEPYQGAATGVGGIMRDIFTMGARPICSIDSLRFGPITPSPRFESAASDGEAIANNRRLFAGVVAATDPRLGRKLGAFRNAVKDHLGYICERIPVLDPSFSDACRALWAEIPKDLPANSN